MGENSAIGQLTLYEDPVPVDFSHLAAPKKHQVGQDQHGGGTRCKGGVKATAGLWGEELDLQEKTGSVSSQGAGKQVLRCLPALGRHLLGYPTQSPSKAVTSAVLKTSIPVTGTLWSKQSDDTPPTCSSSCPTGSPLMCVTRALKLAQMWLQCLHTFSM